MIKLNLNYPDCYFVGHEISKKILSFKTTSQPSKPGIPVGMERPEISFARADSTIQI